MKKRLNEEDKHVGTASFLVLGSIREVLKNVDGKVDCKFLLSMIDSQFEAEHTVLCKEDAKNKKKDYIG